LQSNNTQICPMSITKQFFEMSFSIIVHIGKERAYVA
jgi:hypothetical protein